MEHKVDKVKCECGHVNPSGTKICVECGKPFQDKNELLDMRYEGAALRSQTNRKTFIDQIWNFFASVKIGIWFMVIILVASMLGTFYPQELFIPSTAVAEEYYAEQYGLPGTIFVALGLHNMYGSWWYTLLLVLFGISLTISSIDRGLPLYRALKRQRVKRHPSFLSRQQIHAQTTANDPRQIFKKAQEALINKRYRIRQEDEAIMAEKGRWCRWGPYVVHIGLILILIGALMRTLPGFTLDEYVFVTDGETKPIPGTQNQYYVKSEGFYLEAYQEEDFPGLLERINEGQLIPKEFRTEAILYERVEDEETGQIELVEVKQHSILVNDPLEYEGLKLYQADYVLNEFSKFIFSVTHKETGDSVGEIAIDLHDPKADYPLGEGYHVELREYYPDFEMNQNGVPGTKGPVPNNPAFIFNVITPDIPEGELSWIFLGRTVEMPGEENQYEMNLSDVKMNSVSGLKVAKELSLPFIYFGLAVVMLGLIMSFYWQHRRIWLQNEGDVLWVAAHTNKNWFGIKKEVDYLIDQTGLNIDKETLVKETLDKEV